MRGKKEERNVFGSDSKFRFELNFNKQKKNL